ncbi:hypothetical protein CK203_081475 [Vitis vinifera]|uniref:DUF4283 domain-containing protein n=1 Tax=Vitis vinifera TaxID=29760 RepID=A0A438DYR2_VITVI|nr:hypothetical protein CK203_081475 [Vitis vinifera]
MSLPWLLEGVEDCCEGKFREPFRRVWNEGGRSYKLELRSCSNKTGRLLLCSAVCIEEKSPCVLAFGGVKGAGQALGGKNRGGIKQLGVSQEVSSGEVGWFFKLVASFGHAEFGRRMKLEWWEPDAGYFKEGACVGEVCFAMVIDELSKRSCRNPEVRDNKKRSSCVVGECRRKKGDVLQMSCKKSSLDGELLGPPCRSLGHKALNELDTGERNTCFFSSLPKTSSLSLSKGNQAGLPKFGLGGKFTLHLGMPLGAPFKSVTIWDGVEKRFRGQIKVGANSERFLVRRWSFSPKTSFTDPEEAWVKDVRSGTAEGIEVLALQEEDRVQWMETKDGIFSTKSLYKFLGFISNEEHLEVVCEAKSKLLCLGGFLGVSSMFPLSIRETLLGWTGFFMGKKRKTVWRAGVDEALMAEAVGLKVDLMWYEEKGPSGKELEVNQVVEAYCLSKGRSLALRVFLGTKGEQWGFSSLYEVAFFTPSLVDGFWL